MPVHLERVYETDMAEGLKAMAIEGHGVAFLPFSAVRNELASGRLVSAVPAGSSKFQLPMDVLAYREKPTSKDNHKSVGQALWSFLQHQAVQQEKKKAD